MSIKEEIEKIFRSTCRQAVMLAHPEIGPKEMFRQFQKGFSHFEGDPTLPKGFEWPCALDTVGLDDNVMVPLHFIAQIDLDEASGYDKTGLLPKTGYLYFFTRVCYEHWDEKNSAATRVYYFKEKPKELFTYKAPEYISDSFRPNTQPNAKYIKFKAGESFSYADIDKVIWDYCEAAENSDEPPEENGDIFTLRDEVYEDFRNDSGVFTDLVNGFMGFSHMLGLESYVQERHDDQCAEIYSKIYGEPSAADDWLVLLQYVYIPSRVYITFHIRREDLKNCRFDRVWATMDFD